MRIICIYTYEPQLYLMYMGPMWPMCVCKKQTLAAMTMGNCQPTGEFVV